MKKQRHHFADKGPYSQSYGFSSSHVQMSELDHDEGWGPKNWCFQTVVLEKTLESPLDCKEIQPVHPKGNHSWIFIGRIDAEAKAEALVWPPDMNSWLTGKDPEARKHWGQEERQARGWDGWLASVSMSLSKLQEAGQGSRVCCSPWGLKELDMTEQLNKWLKTFFMFHDYLQKPCKHSFFFFFFLRKGLGLKVTRTKNELKV